MEDNVRMPAYQHAAVHPDARIGKNVTIGPWVSIEADVVIGDNTSIGANVCIMSGTRIGKNCQIFPGAIIGAIPQDLKYSGEDTTLEIGDNVIIREYCTLNRGTRANYKTVIGNNCLLMAYVHVAHDCVIGEHCILANNATLSGARRNRRVCHFRRHDSRSPVCTNWRPCAYWRWYVTQQRCPPLCSHLPLSRFLYWGKYGWLASQRVQFYRNSQHSRHLPPTLCRAPKCL